MAPVSCSKLIRSTAARRARRGGASSALALLAILAALLALPSARADIYKWTDEQGGTVVSDVPPVDASKVSGMTRLSVSRPAAPAAQSAAERRQRELEARVDELERELAEQQAAQPPQEAPPPADSGGYYPAPPPPPVDAGYYASDQYAESPLYFPNYYVPPIAYTVITVPVRHFEHRQRHAHPPLPRPVTATGPVFAGRSPQFVSRAPQFVARPPAFASRPPAIATRPLAMPAVPAAGFARAAHSGGTARYGAGR